MLRTIIRLVELLEPQQRTLFWLLPVPMLLTAALEMIGIGMIVPVLQLAFGDRAELSSTSIRPFADLFRGLPDADALVILAGGFAAVILMKNVAILGVTYLINRFTMKNLSVFTRRLFSTYLEQPYTAHLARNSAELVRNLTVTCSNVFQGYRLFLGLVLECCLAAGAFAVLVFVEPATTIVATAAGALLLIVAYRWLAPRFHAWGDDLNRSRATHIRVINQSLGAIKEVKIRHCEPFLAEGFGRLTDRIVRVQLLNSTVQEVPRLAIEILVVCAFAAAVVFLQAAGRTGAEIITIVGLFGMASMRLMPAVNRILTNANGLRFIDSHLEDLHRDALRCGSATATKMIKDPGASISFQQEMRLENLCYSYPGAAKPALDSINLVVPKGEAIGLVGPSGSGKSTMIDVLLGLLQPSSGRVFADGIEISTAWPNWQRKFGYVPQDVYLIDDTVRRNIAFGLRDGEIEEEKVWMAVKRAHLEDVVAQLPDGLDTIVGERGSRISGGERQRVGIARALYRDPEILVLDEATSALDSLSEDEIRRAIRELARTKTIVIIAHRMSTVRECDRILYLHGGVLRGIGRFSDLIEVDAGFREFVKKGEFVVPDAPSLTLDEFGSGRR